MRSSAFSRQKKFASTSAGDDSRESGKRFSYSAPMAFGAFPADIERNENRFTADFVMQPIKQEANLLVSQNVMPFRPEPRGFLEKIYVLVAAPVHDFVQGNRRTGSSCALCV